MSSQELEPPASEILTNDSYWHVYEHVYRITRSEALVRWQVELDLRGSSAAVAENAGKQVSELETAKIARERVIETLETQRPEFCSFADHGCKEFPLEIEARLRTLFENN